MAALVTRSRVEPTLSSHSTTKARRALLSWLTVLTTFALGTTVGDLMVTTCHRGDLGSGLLFAGCFAVPGLAYGLLRTSAVALFWISYLLTRQHVASLAERVGGLGLSGVLTAVELVDLGGLIPKEAAAVLGVPCVAFRMRPSRGTVTGERGAPRR